VAQTKTTTTAKITAKTTAKITRTMGFARLARKQLLGREQRPSRNPVANGE